jgi:argininosuccinate lyase
MVMSRLEVNRNILGDDRYKYLFSVEEVNKLVLQGIPFRDAYKQIAETIQNGSFKPVMKTAHTHEGSSGNLCNDKIAMRMDQVMNDFNFQKMDEAVNALLENGKK